MLTKEIKYRYKIAIFYRFLPIPIFNFWTLLIPIPIFAFNNIPIAIPISPNIPINRYWYRLYPLLVFPIKLYPNSLLLPDVLKTVKLFSTRTHVLKLRKVCSNSGFCYTLWHVCFWQTSKSKVPSRDSSPNFRLGVFFKNWFSNHLPIHPPNNPPPPKKVFMSYVEGRSLNESCLSISVGIKDKYCNS